MVDLIESAKEVQNFLDEHNWPNCIIGGIAMARWSPHRFTGDADFSVMVEFGQESEFIDLLLSRYSGRGSQDPKAFALAARVLLLESLAGYPIDVALGSFPFEHRLIGRASVHEYVPGVVLKTCSADDLIVLKLFAGRVRDLEDCKYLAYSQAEILNWNQIEADLTEIAQMIEEPEILDRLTTLRNQ